ncbi:hypothetical protein COOONC_18681, partial [Cooperia oncophora]
LVVGVCFERVIGVRSPLHRLVVPSKRRLVAGGSCETATLRPSLPHLLRQYVKWMRAANVALVVVIPLVFLVVLNTMLMYYVKKRYALLKNTLNLSFKRTLIVYDLEVITSFMVIIGKCLNFVVFCLSSDNFRQKLLVIVRARCGGMSEEKYVHRSQYGP